jgi:hypothetical protein
MRIFDADLDSLDVKKAHLIMGLIRCSGGGRSYARICICFCSANREIYWEFDEIQPVI